MVIGAREQAVADLAISIAHAVIGTLQRVTITAARGEITIVVVGVLVRDPDLLMMIDIIDLAVELDVTKMTNPEIEVHAVTVPAAESGRRVQRANHQHPNPPRMRGTGGLSLYNNLLLD